MVMEVKLSHRNHFSQLPKSLLANNTKTNFPPNTFCLKSWAATERRRFQGLMKKWRLQNNNSKNYHCTHLVKQGETLSSISKMYGVSVYSIAAANKDIVETDLVFKGQLLNIPASSFLQTHLELAKKSRLWQTIHAFKAPSKEKLFTIITQHGLSNAKATGYFLVLVPLIAFCIRCVISIFRVRVSRDVLRHEALDKSKRNHLGAKSKRWKSALIDSVEVEAFDSKSELDSNNTSEDEDEDEAYIFSKDKEASHAYRKVQQDYQKFLSECGMSEWGYWRGGSPGT